MRYESRIGQVEIKELKLRHLNRDLFAALSPDRLLRRLTYLDVPADQIPAVWIPAPCRMPEAP